MARKECVLIQAMERANTSKGGNCSACRLSVTYFVRRGKKKPGPKPGLFDTVTGWLIIFSK